MADESPEKQSELRTLVDLSTLISSSLDIQTVLDNAMTCAQLSMNAEASAIFELDRERDELFFRIALGDTAEKVKKERIRIGEGIAGWVARTGEPLIIPNALSDPRFLSSVDARTGFETRSIICVPMMYKGELTGALEVLNKKNGLPFDEKDLEMLTVLANQVAIAIENAKLYSRLNEKFTLATKELKIAQERLIRTERLAALGKLSQGVAHEVRNPVTIIGGFARRLQTQFSDNDVIRDALEIILIQTQRLERMVIDIEAYTRLRGPELRPVDISTVAEASLSEFSKRLEAQGIKVRTDFRTEAHTVEADKELLQLAFGKVLLNAIEAMPTGGTLEVRLMAGRNRMVFSLKDSGLGIQPENLPNVFDPFFTSKTSGSGLGLATAHRIISEHWGEIEIDSTPGEGTEVRIFLPYKG